MSIIINQRKIISILLSSINTPSFQEYIPNNYQYITTHKTIRSLIFTRRPLFIKLPPHIDTPHNISDLQRQSKLPRIIKITNHQYKNRSTLYEVLLTKKLRL